MLKALPNPDYLPELVARIEKARRSIVVVNYLAELRGERLSSKGSPMSALTGALLAARRRGVEVSATLEGSRLDNNYPFYRLLKDGGCDVWLDTSMTLIHQKAVLIDDRVLIAGSHNLTDASLTRNEELSLMTDDARAIGIFRRELRSIESQRDEVRSRGDVAKVSLPAAVLAEVFAPLNSSRAGNALNLYLLLCREDGGVQRPVPIDERGWCEALGFDPKSAAEGVTEKYRRYYYKQRIDSVLGQLSRKFDLVAVDRDRDTVVRKPLPEGKVRIEIPKTLWDFGWLARLSLAAKYFYTLSLHEKAGSPFYPWWSRSMRELGDRYGCDRHGIGRGATELEDFGILEVLRDIPVVRGSFTSVEAHYYRLNPFYDMKEFDRRLAVLKEKFGIGAVETARSVAGSFWKTHDLEIIESICELTRLHGQGKIKAAGRKIARLPAFSSRRAYGYLEELL